MKELSRYFISREDVRGEVEGAKDEEAFKTLCNLCRAYQVASTYNHRKLNVPSLHNDPNDMGTWDDLSKSPLASIDEAIG